MQNYAVPISLLKLTNKEVGQGKAEVEIYMQKLYIQSKFHTHIFKNRKWSVGQNQTNSFREDLKTQSFISH